MNNEPRATIYANRRNAPKSNGPHSQKVLEIRSITLFLCAFVPLCLCSFVPLFLRACPLSFTLVVSALQIRLFMQNKPNFRKSQMNVRAYKTKIYGNWTLSGRGKNEPKTNPIYPVVASGEAGTNPIYPCVASGEAGSKPIKANKMPKQNQNKAKTKPISGPLSVGNFLAKRVNK